MSGRVPEIAALAAWGGNGVSVFMQPLVQTGAAEASTHADKSSVNADIPSIGGGK